MVRARDSLIFATIDVMRRRGSAAGLADIVAASGRSRRTVYLNFPDGKSEMVCAATEYAGDAMNDLLTATAEIHAPTQALRMFIAGWVSVLTDSDFESGCPILAAALSRHESPGAAASAGLAFDRWAATLSAALVRSGVDARTADEVATTLVATTEGAVVMCQAKRSIEPLVQSEAGMLRLLASVAPGAEPRG